MNNSIVLLVRKWIEGLAKKSVAKIVGQLNLKVEDICNSLTIGKRFSHLSEPPILKHRICVNIRDMKRFWITAICFLVLKQISIGQATDLTFPKDFIIGAGSAAYQIEGAWNEGGKGESIWDFWTHNNPDQIADRSNGDIAARAYHTYKEDVQLIKSIGLDSYRFSISWSRVLPTGRTNNINEEGLQYYKNLTAELVENGITPIVTMYHWDHPQDLETLGGWTNEIMADWFVEYARVLFKAMGDSVKIWTTINEPNIFCSGAYAGHNPPGILAPGKEFQGHGQYLCVHNMLKAHAMAYHMYDEEFRDTQQGEVGIVAHCATFIPKDSGDTEIAETAFEFHCGWIFHPIYIGDYPEIMKTRIAIISAAQGYETSRLPEFSEEWISFINGTTDYLGLNHYWTALVAADPDEEKGIYNSDSGAIYSADPTWTPTYNGVFYVTPGGFYDLLCRVKDQYGNPPVRVTENGYSDDGVLEDYGRISYLYQYLTALLKAVHEYGCDVISYSVWSFLDDFEWNSGYGPKYGLVYVDFNDTDRSRTAKLSASWLSSVIRNRELPPLSTQNFF